MAGRLTTGAAVLALAGSLLFAQAAGAEQSDFALQFASRAPGVVTGVRLHIVYRRAADPNGKPSPIRHLVIAAPDGTRIDIGAPSCTASDQQLMIEGPSACPADSEVGQGTLSAITGFGPPVDPYWTDVSIFNTGHGWVEDVRDRTTGATLANDRIDVERNVMTGNPPAVPGGPPDGQTAVRTIDFTFPAYFTTPPTCATGEWTSRASFSFADGTTQRVSSTTPCDLPRSATPRKRHSPHRRRRHHKRHPRPRRHGEREE